MAQQFVLKVNTPLGGIVKSTAYQSQPPFTSYDSLNMWPLDAKTGRLVLATRPGLTPLTAPSGAVHMLARVSGVSSGNPFQSFVTSIDGTIYYWDGTQLVSATGAKAADVDTNRNVSAAAVIDKLYITKDSEKPIVFDYTDGTATTLTESAGTAPVDTRIAVEWNGALALAARQAQPHILYISRVGDPTDWDFSVADDDLFGAFFSDAEFDGILAGPITALMPQTSDTMLVSTTGGTLALRGHPRQGGLFERVGSAFALGQGAWAQAPNGRIYVLTQLGMMAIDPTPGAVFTPVSRNKIPNDLIGLLYDYSDPVVTMIYDSRWDSINIFVRGLQEQAWRFDLATGGFSRDEISSYPFAAVEFPDFKTENVSGVLLGRYDGIKFFDRFATETINSSSVIGPVRLAEIHDRKSKIQKMRVVLGRDTPTVANSGDIKLAVGTDGQDAVARLLQGTHQYSVDLTTLKNNNGVCYPKVTGHAVAVGVTSTDGDIAIEEIELTAIDAGVNRTPRSSQIAITGAATSFTDSFVELDVSLWKGYSEATPSAPDSELPEHTHFLDLSKMPTSWWDEVAVNGSDIRVSDGSNTQVPSVVVDFDYSNQRGMLIFKMTQPTSPNSVRVWVGNSGTTVPPKDSTYGQHNCFDANYRGFWYDGGGLSNLTQYGDNDATTDELDGTPGALEPLYGQETGPLGAGATDFDGGNGANSVTYWEISEWATSQGLTANQDWTFAAAFKQTQVPDLGTNPFISLLNGLSNRLQLRGRDDGSLAEATYFADDSSVRSAISSDIGAVDEWRLYTGVESNFTDRFSFVDGAGKGTNTDTVTTDLTDADLLVGSVSAVSNDNSMGHIALVQAHNTVRSDDWIKYQGEMMDQVTFWGTIGAFTLVNEVEDEELDAAACPSGEVAVTEVGTWSGYAEATPADPTSSLLNFSHLIDLSQMPASWWSAVASDGSDIRATNSDNIFMPIDLIEFDKTGNTGLAVVKMSQTEGSPGSIRLWVGNGSAVTLPACGAYGQYNAYDTNFRGFWPSGTGNDRTQWLNNLTTTGSPTVDAAQSPVGSQATLFDNSSSTTQYATTTVNLPTTVPITIHASVVRPASSVHEDRVIAALQSSTNSAAFLLHTKPSDSPARVTVRSALGLEEIAGNNTSITPTTDWFQDGRAAGNNSRVVLVDGGGTSLSPETVVVVNGLDTFIVGADLESLDRGWNGHVSLVGLHDVARSDAWDAYWNASLTQSSFWDTWTWTAEVSDAYWNASLTQSSFWDTWTWTAEVSGLPQP